MISEDLLERLACPWCVTRPEAPPAGERKGELALVGSTENPTGLKCAQCRRVYQIIDGIPNLLLDEAVVDDGA